MINPPPLEEPFGSSGWKNWFTLAFRILRGFGDSSLSGLKSLDFPAIAAQSQQSLTFAAKGTTAGDIIMVYPTGYVAGLIFNGYVLTDGVVTVVATNITSGSINPPAMNFRIIAVQNS